MAETIEFDGTEVYGAEAAYSSADDSSSDEASKSHDHLASTFQFDDFDPNNHAEGKSLHSGGSSGSTLGMAIPEDVVETSASPPINMSVDASSRPAQSAFMDTLDVQGFGDAVRRTGHSRMAQSLPVQLATSAPIHISRRPSIPRPLQPKEGDDQGKPKERANWQGFVPPHQLSQRYEWQFSVSGLSPSASAKREKLRARNAILRSTGFLEPVEEMQKALLSPIGFQEQVRVRQGGLAAMLSQNNEAAGTAAAAPQAGTAAVL